MNFGFVINNRTCIGCHACSTACKSENDVPLGVYRTWVKYTEAGSYPDTRRSFQVTRCNHCANPPCARICPVTAMYQRQDGIVEFDGDQCIGCKACMQACPYDAIYIDPNSGTAAKCHYCAHRTEIGLEPACVVVCPEHAIISGDIDDPNSEISQVIAREKVSVRKPEQGTAPKLFYIEGQDISLHPTVGDRKPESFMWADAVGDKAEGRAPPTKGGGSNLAKNGTPIWSPQSQGAPTEGPIQIGHRVAEHMVQVGYNAQHKVPWHWPVPAYLVTKGVGSGLFILLAVLGLLGDRLEPSVLVAGGFTSLLFMIITTALLVLDLERPERFLRIVFRPQWNSWLTRGAFILIGFSTVAGLWWVVEAGAMFGVLPTALAEQIRPWAFAIGLPLALGSAVYTAFLFGQAEGRDLWQSPLLPVHLVVQAIMAGAAGLLIVSWLAGDAALPALSAKVLFASLAVDLLVTLFGEFAMPHASEIAARAAKDITRGRYKNHFWWGSVALGHVVPMSLLALGAAPLAALAAVATVVGLYFYEHAFVMAPQEIPNS